MFRSLFFLLVLFLLVVFPCPSSCQVQIGAVALNVPGGATFVQQIPISYPVGQRLSTFGVPTCWNTAGTNGQCDVFGGYSSAAQIGFISVSGTLPFGISIGTSFGTWGGIQTTSSFSAQPGAWSGSFWLQPYSGVTISQGYWSSFTFIWFTPCTFIPVLPNGIVATTAWPTLPARYNSASVTLACVSGSLQGSNQLRCDYSGRWTNNNGASFVNSSSALPSLFCLDAAPRNLRYHLDPAALNPYAVAVTWDLPTNLPGFISRVDVQYQHVWPSTNSIDFQLAYLSGVTSAVQTVSSLTNTTAFYSFVTDTKSQIEHTRGQFSVRSWFQPFGGGTATSSQWVTLNVSSPCACNVNRAAQQPDPLAALLYGLPLGMSARQLTDASNAIQFTFTPNSLCSNQYLISTSALDGTPINADPITFNTPYVDNTQSCSALAPSTQNILAVSYPMYGRPLSLCVRPMPQTICTSCVSAYGTPAAEWSGQAPQGCVEIVPMFFTTIRGVVSTNPTPLAPTSAPLSGITVTITLVDPVSLLPLPVYDPVSRVNITLESSTITDSRGRYRVQLTSRLLQGEVYTILVRPYRADFDSETNQTLVHRFASTSISSQDYFTDNVKHAQEIVDVSFHDLSEVPLFGSVILDPNGVWYGSTAFQGCGVPNIRITAYSANDIEFKTPLRQTTPTRNDGKFVLTSPLQTNLVLVPSFVQYSTLDIQHQFQPSQLFVRVRQSTIHLNSFIDTSVGSFTAIFNGGLCEYHVGAISPLIEFTSCGISARIQLPKFASGIGYTYTLPAQILRLKLRDNADPATSTGLQAIDLSGAHLPTSYLNGPVFTWIAAYPPLQIDLRPTNLNLVNESRIIRKFTYFDIPKVELLDKPICSDSSVLSPTSPSFLYFSSNTQYVLTWEFTETYGYVDASDQTSYVQICRNVAGGVFLIDRVSDDNRQLASYYLEPPYNCKFGRQGCTMPAVYNRKTDKTLARYILIAGPVELSEHADGNGNHFRPPHSKQIQYKLAGSVLPLEHLNVVITGTHAYPGSLTLGYPPFDPLYILRRPPGGNSFAALKSGSTVSIANSISTTNTRGESQSLGFSAGYEGELDICAGLGIATCETTLAISIDATVRTASSTEGTKSRSSTQQEDKAFSQTVQTSQSPNLIDGLGDLFLTVSGSIDLQQATIIDGKIDQLEDPQTGDVTYSCETTAKPSLSWNRDPKSTMQWISTYDVLYVTIPGLELANQLLMESYLTDDETSFMSVAKSEDKKRFNDNKIAIKGWQKMLDYNEKLKEEAEEWPDFYQHIRVPDDAPAASKELITSALANKGEDGATTGDAGGPVPSGPTSSLESNGDVGSITFFGDTSFITFEISTISTKTSEYSMETTVSEEEAFEISSSIAIFGVSLGVSADGSYTLTTTKGNSGALSRTTETTLTIFLSDADPGDVFKIKVMRDPVFGSPVYKTIAGQSRCPVEAGTVSRDLIQIGFATSVFDHVNPRDSTSTVLSMVNLSPTREEFAYTLSLLQETSLYGLKVAINGEILSSSAGGSLVYTLPYQQELQVTVDIDIGSNGYKFDDVAVQLVGSGAGDCLAATTTFSIHYDQECNQVAFAGALSANPSFLVNRDVVDNAGGQTSLTIAIRNPQFTLRGRKWLDNYVESSEDGANLESIRILYRPVIPGAIAQSDLAWQDVIPIGSDGPIDILATMLETFTQTGNENNDIFALDWDLSPLSDGFYQLMVEAKCTVPTGALDTSLYSTRTNIVTGNLDVNAPVVFGTPLPATAKYLPGQPISVTFDSIIDCKSMYGAARAFAWVNPTLIKAPRSQGLNLPIQFVCRESTLSIAFLSPIWDNLVNRLITIRVDRVRDVAGNVIEFPVEWSFIVDQFDTSRSSVHIQGLQLAVDLSTLLRRYGSLGQLQLEISTEIADLVNKAIDTIVNPAVPASTSSNGLIEGSVIVSLAAQGTRSVRLDVDILNFPLFPGESPSPYSPSFFSHYLQLAVLPIAINATIVNNTTVNSTLLYRDQESFPVLHHLVSSDNLVTTIRPAFASNSPQSAIIGTNFASVFGYSSFSSSVGVNTAQMLGVISMSWMTTDSLALVLTPSSFQLSYLQLADSFADPDVRAEFLLSDAATTPTIVSSSKLSIICNVQSGTSPRAVYQLSLVDFPIAAGGASFKFLIRVHNISASANSAPLYTIEESVFVTGPPNLPVLTSVNQVDLSTVSVTFYPALRNGLDSFISDSDVRYQMSITPVGGVQVVPSPSLVSSSDMIDSFGRRLITLTLDLKNSSFSSQIGLALPQPGTSIQWFVSVSSVNNIGSAPGSPGMNITIGSVPDYQSIHRVSQLHSIQQIEVRFHSNPLYRILALQLPTLSDTRLSPLALQQYRLTYWIELLNGTTRTHSLTYAISDISVITSSVQNSNGKDLLALTFTLNTIDIPCRNMRISIQTMNGLGISSQLQHSAAAPSFAPPPTDIQVSQLAGTPCTSTECRVTISWTATDPNAVLPSAALLKGYYLALTYSDGLTLNGEVASTQLGLRNAVNVSLPLVSSPVSGRTVTFRVQLTSSVLRTLSSAVIARTDGTGQQMLQSLPVVGELTLNAARQFIWPAGSLPAPVSTSSTSSIPAASTSLASSSSSLSVLSLGGGDFNSIVTSSVILSGPLVNGAPIAIADVQVFQSSQLDRIVVAFLPSSACHTVSTCPAGSTQYYIQYYSVTSPIPLETYRFQPVVTETGVAFETIVSPALTQYNVINAAAIQNGQLSVQSSLSFKFVIGSSNSAGSSPTSVVYVSIRQQPYQPPADAIPSSLLGIAQAILVIVIIGFIGLGGLVKGVYQAQASKRNTSGEDATNKVQPDFAAPNDASSSPHVATS